MEELLKEMANVITNIDTETLKKVAVIINTELRARELIRKVLCD